MPIGIPCFLLPTDWAIDNNPRGRIIEAILKNWLAEDAKNVVDGDGGRRIARWADIDDAMEFVSGFGEAVRERLDQQYRGRRAADRHHESIMFAWLRSVRLLDIVGMSRVWHRRMANAESILVAMPSTSPDQPESPWPVLLPEAITIENRIVVQLIDRQGLIAEGEVLGHCIGTYAGRCRSGGSVIFSIRSLAGDNLSTLELDLLDSGLLTIRGHKAARNGAPSDDCQLAAMELVKHLNSDAGADGRAAMAERRRLVETGKLVFARDRDSAPSPSAELAWAVVQGSRHALQFEFVG